MDTRVTRPAETYVLSLYEHVLCSEDPSCWGETEMNMGCMDVGEHGSHTVMVAEPESGRRLGAQIPAWKRSPVWDLIEQEINTNCFWVIIHIWAGVLQQLKVCDTLTITFVKVKSH